MMPASRRLRLSTVPFTPIFALLLLFVSVNSASAQGNATDETAAPATNSAAPVAAAPEKSPSLAAAAVSEKANSATQLGPYIEYMRYEGRAWSRSRKAELGEQSVVDTALGYRFSPETSGHIRLEIDPYYENDYDNKTSKIELLVRHRISTLTTQLDLDMNTNDYGTGGMSFGPDLDSEKTFLAWQPNDMFRLTLYPYNFHGSVGTEFYIRNVTRINFIEGAPNILNNTPLTSEYIRYKTIPGIELALTPIKDFTVYVGGGAASYLYPSNEDFSFENNLSTPRWEWRQDVGYKAGANYERQNMRMDIKHVSHNKSAETGSLYASATSARLAWRTDPVFVMTEFTQIKTGQNPFRLARDGKWFEDATPFEPIYTDYYTERQDWLGKRDSAYMIKAGAHFGDTTPYIGYKAEGKYFIHNDRESAHRLRTADESESHGGLRTYMLGTNFNFEGYQVRPEIEWLRASNKVFGSASDVRQDRFLSDLNKTDTMFTMYVTYNIDEKAVY